MDALGKNDDGIVLGCYRCNCGYTRTKFTCSSIFMLHNYDICFGHRASGRVTYSKYPRRVIISKCRSRVGLVQKVEVVARKIGGWTENGQQGCNSGGLSREDGCERCSRPA